MHGSLLFPGTLLSMHNSIALRNRQLSLSSRIFSSESPPQGSKTVFHPCADGMFQHGFGSQLAVVGFLNALLGLEGKAAITSVEYLSRALPSENTLPRAGYSFAVDLRCSSNDGRHFLVEMQNDFRPHYHMKALVEHSRMISALDLLHMKRNVEETIATEKTSRSKEFWRDIEGIYTIIITNKASSVETLKKMYRDEPVSEPCLLNRYELRHTEHLNRHYGDKPFQIILFTVNNLKKSLASELESSIEQWAYVFQDSMLRSGTAKIPETKTIEGMDFVTAKNPGIKAFIDRIHVGAVPSEVLNKYLQDMKYFNEGIVSIHEEGIQKGKEEGIQIGKEEGIQIGKEEGIQLGKEEGIQIGIKEGIQLGKEEGIQMIRNVVLSLKQSGMPIDAIARTAGITSAEVERLISQINSQADTKVA
jgi:hypothetical protein